VSQAIPVIMGANIGTSVTNTIISLSQIKDKEQFRRAFAAATVHDMYNILCVIVLLPIEVMCNYLEFISKKITDGIIGHESKSFDSPINYMVEPLVDMLIQVDEKEIEDVTKGESVASLLKGGIFKSTGLPDIAVGAILLVISLLLLVFSIILMVKILSSLVQGKSQVWLKRGLNMNGYLALLLGLVVTMLVQSSSLTTSTLVPLVGLDLITLEAMYPLTLGTNVGVTMTAMLAALVTESKDGIQVAMAHLIFNISGILIFFPIPQSRIPPLWLARTLGDVTMYHRWFAVTYIIVTFFILPAGILALSLMGTQVFALVAIPILFIILLAIVIGIIRKRRPKWLPMWLQDLSWMPEFCLHLSFWEKCCARYCGCKRKQEEETQKLLE